MDKSGYTITVSDNSSDVVTLRIEGEVCFSNVELLYKEISVSTSKLSGKTFHFDLENVARFDSSGTALLSRLARDFQDKESELHITAASDTVREVLALTDFTHLRQHPEKPPHRHVHLFEIIGEDFIGSMEDFGQLLRYIGRVFLALTWSLKNPFRVRWGEVIGLIHRTGSQALPIVALMSALVGMVTAFSSAVQLRQFGANIFIANLVGIGMTRELGPLMAAILLAGRSGSAFAAEIGTMKISDELDALTVMGIPPLHYLIVPRLLAMMIVMPLLALFADVFGITGGMLISIFSLNLTPIAFLHQLQQAIGLWDVFSGVLKSLFFGILVAAVGCYRGMSTSGGALGVGKSTTSSVVSSIFLIVVADSTFVIIFHYLGVG